MTYYEKLILQARVAMERFPNSTVALDAESFSVIARGTQASRVARRARSAMKQGRTVVVVENPRHEETWIL